MVTITEQAASALSQSLKMTEREAGQTLRLVEQGQSFALEMDTPKEGDQILEHDGETVLAVSQEANQNMGEATIDIEATQAGARLIIRQAQ